MKFQELEIVSLQIDYLEMGLAKGAIGTIVNVYTSPSEAYEVEFCDIQGKTLALLTLNPSDIERAYK